MYPELTGQHGRCRLAVLTGEVGGRWLAETEQCLAAIAYSRGQGWRWTVGCVEVGGSWWWEFVVVEFRGGGISWWWMDVVVEVGDGGSW